jgi:hypothetical protein
VDSTKLETPPNAHSIPAVLEQRRVLSYIRISQYKTPKARDEQ